ncbi:MAG: M20/M25/M40 family metallo-hydrolase [Acidaminococcaceae bacterium]|jgi:tripeptide aminopeptidase|nr:M20/M25/M40 family metallo-hydrolase [Acidaminococcaceae bacterium]
MNTSITINEERLKNTFIELVGVPCPSCDEKQEAELLVKKLQELGMEPQVDRAGEQCGGTTGNVWGFLKGDVPEATRLFFEAHMDSVAPTTGTTVVEKDAVLYSDGTTTLGGDDKSGVAAVLEAMQCIIENNLPHGDIQVCFTIGEETGSYGVRYMDKTMIQADAGYCMDCGGHPGAIFNASPKAINLKLTVKGKSAHAGLEPEKGINAIMLAADAMHALPVYGRIDAETTLSVDMIDGGLAPNIVPESCEVVIDMRCPDETKLERLKSETVEIFRNAVEAKGGTVEIAVKEVAPGVNLDTDHATVKLAATAAVKLGFPVSTGFTGGCSDANFLCGMGLPTVLLATGMDKIHTTEERLALEDLNNAARWVLGIVKEATAKC